MVKNSIGSVSKVFLIILLLIIAIGVLVIPSFGIWRDVAKSECIIEQFSYLRSLEHAVKNARETGAVYPEFKLKVTYCIDCIWYDIENSQLMVKISEQDKAVPFKIETNFQGIGCDCSGCGDKSGGLYCANLRKDTTYAFEVTKEYANFTGYVDNEGNVQPGGFSSKPCQPCVGYDGACGDVGGEKIPCCFGTECKARPVLWEVNWLGEEIGHSLYSWVGKKCLKSLGEECNDFTECSTFVATDEGHESQYPCHTISDYSGDRCCSPLLSVKQTGEGSTDSPASDCDKYGGCEVYCGNVTCGYVYNSSLERFTNICCKPLGEECWNTDNTWQCCAHQLNISAVIPPTQCLQDDGDPCTSGSTNCQCCISPGYNCTYETIDYCCKPYTCQNITTGAECGEGEECMCRP